MGISNLLLNLFSKKDEQKIKNYIFQGGSTKGIAYIGALQELEDHGIKLENIQRIGGTSIGAITAALLCIGYDLKKLNDELKNMNFENFIDIEDDNIQTKLKKYENTIATDLFQKKILETFEFIKGKLNGVETFYMPHKLKRYKNIYDNFTNDETYQDLFAILEYAYNNKGLAKGKKILDWIEEKIETETKIQHLTFANLHEFHKANPKKYKKLYIIGTNVSKRRSEVFSHEKTPNVVISDAVRISMSLPVVFQPHQRYEKKDGKRKQDENNKDMYVDGGMMDNYPIWLFDEKCSQHDRKYNNNINSETLGFRLAPLKTIIYNATKDSSVLKIYLKDEKQVMSNNGFIWSLVGCFYDKQDSDFDLQSDKHLNRTILINNNNMSMFKFNLSNHEKMDLIALGQNSASIYLNEQKNRNSFKDTRDTRENPFYKIAVIIGVGFVGVLAKMIINRE